MSSSVRCHFSPMRTSFKVIHIFSKVPISLLRIVTYHKDGGKGRKRESQQHSGVVVFNDGQWYSGQWLDTYSWKQLGQRNCSYNNNDKQQQHCFSQGLCPDVLDVSTQRSSETYKPNPPRCRGQRSKLRRKPSFCSSLLVTSKYKASVTHTQLYICYYMTYRPQ